MLQVWEVWRDFYQEGIRVHRVRRSERCRGRGAGFEWQRNARIGVCSLTIDQACFTIPNGPIFIPVDFGLNWHGQEGSVTIATAVPGENVVGVVEVAAAVAVEAAPDAVTNAVGLGKGPNTVLSLKTFPLRLPGR